MPKVGRPRGPSPAISKELDEIAYLIVSKKAKSANNAIEKVIALRPQKKDDILHDSARQSLHRWWRRQKTERLEDARNRYQERTHSRSSGHSVSMRDYATAFGASEAARDSLRAIAAGKEMSGLTASIASLGVNNPSVTDALSKLHGQSAAIAASMAHLQSPSVSAALGMQKEADRIKKMLDPLGYHARASLPTR